MTDEKCLWAVKYDGKAEVFDTFEDAVKFIDNDAGEERVMVNVTAPIRVTVNQREA